MSNNVFIYYTKTILLSCVIILFITLPAHAATMQLKGGYSDIGSNGSSLSGFMGNLEYLFNSYMGITAQFEGYNQTVGATTSNTSVYTAYLTLHSDIQTQDSPNAYLNNFLNMYYQVGYASMQTSSTTGGTTTTNPSAGGFAYGIGLDIMPKSNFGGFVGYKGASFNQNGVISTLGGLVAGIEMRL